MKKIIAMIIGAGLIGLGLANGQWRTQPSGGSSWQSRTASSQSGSNYVNQGSAPKSSEPKGSSAQPQSYAAPTVSKAARISITLPTTPVDVWVEGILVKEGAIQLLELVTPELPEGLFRYRLVLVDSQDKSKRSDYEISDISAGKSLNVDLSSGI